FVAWPLNSLRWAQGQFPGVHWLLQESKLFGALGLGLLCALAATRSPGPSDDDGVTAPFY
ncbi:MAG: hypothetical protein AAFV53_35795, partial [Myxococcota bacterium]